MQNNKDYTQHWIKNAHGHVRIKLIRQALLYLKEEMAMIIKLHFSAVTFSWDDRKKSWIFKMRQLAPWPRTVHFYYGKAVQYKPHFTSRHNYHNLLMANTLQSTTLPLLLLIKHDNAQGLSTIFCLFVCLLVWLFVCLFCFVLFFVLFVFVLFCFVF